MKKIIILTALAISGMTGAGSAFAGMAVNTNVEALNAENSLNDTQNSLATQNSLTNTQDLQSSLGLDSQTDSSSPNPSMGVPMLPTLVMNGCSDTDTNNSSLGSQSSVNVQSSVSTLMDAN